MLTTDHFQIIPVSISISVGSVEAAHLDTDARLRAIKIAFLIPASFAPESCLSAIQNPGQRHAGVAGLGGISYKPR